MRGPGLVELVEQHPSWVRIIFCDQTTTKTIPQLEAPPNASIYRFTQIFFTQVSLSAWTVDYKYVVIRL